MRILSARFAASAVDPSQYPPDELPEVAFAGRSNVGKSSLINALLLRKGLVKTGSTPGRTRTLGFFVVNDAFRFVDLPGYGYSKVPREVQFRFGPMVETYLERRRRLAAVVQILDARHAPARSDLALRAYLRHHGLRVVTVATKADKLPRGRLAAQRERLARVLDLGPDEPLILFSAVSKLGRRERWRCLAPLVGGRAAASEAEV